MNEINLRIRNALLNNFIKTSPRISEDQFFVQILEILRIALGTTLGSVSLLDTITDTNSVLDANQQAIDYGLSINTNVPSVKARVFNTSTLVLCLNALLKGPKPETSLFATATQMLRII